MDPTAILVLQFLQLLVTGAGTGKAVDFTMEELKRLWPSTQPEWSADAKFYFAVLLSLLYPVLAYVAIWLITGGPFNWAGLALAFAGGYITSQKFHRNRQAPILAAQRQRLAAFERRFGAYIPPVKPPVNE